MWYTYYDSFRARCSGAESYTRLSDGTALGSSRTNVPVDTTAWRCLGHMLILQALCPDHVDRLDIVLIPCR